MTPEEQKKKAPRKKAAPKAPIKQADHAQTIGKRKTAIARATLVPGKGKVRINGQLLAAYTPEFARMRIQEPLLLAGQEAAKIDIDVRVQGGGWQGQSEAARLAIGRALVATNKQLKKVFLEYDRHLLIQDVRYRETRKPNDSKARAARQKSYR